MKNIKAYFFFALICLFLSKTYFDIGFIKKNSSPWVSCLADEYQYINRARNVAIGISNVSDENYAANYPPPLYSLSLLPAHQPGDPFASYQNSKAITIIISNFIFLISFIIIALKIKPFLDTKTSTLYLLICLSTATLSSIAGFYNSIMTENLFLPLIFLIFAIFTYFDNKKLKKSEFIFASSITLLLTLLATLTREAGVFALPAVLVSLLFLDKNKINKKTLFSKILTLLIITLFIYILPQIILNRFIYHTGSSQGNYVKGAGGFLGGLVDLILLKYKFSTIFILLKNQISYIIIATFIFPAFFYLKNIIKVIKSKKATASFIFLSIFGIICFTYALVHNAKGFDRDPLGRSLYSRYLDPFLAPLYFYGALELFKSLKNKTQKINLKFISTFLITALILVFWFIFAYKDIMPVGLNNFGVTWLRLFSDNFILILAIIAIFYLIYYFFLKKDINLAYILLSIILLINIRTYSVNSSAIKNDSTLYFKLVPTLSNLNLAQNDYQFFVRQDDLDRENSFLLEVYYYYLKWYLSYYSDELVVINKINDYQELDPQANNIILISGSEYQENQEKYQDIYQIHSNYALATLKYEE